MNITDEKDVRDYPYNIWKAIYDEQYELMVKYHKEEAKNGFPDFEPPLKLNDPKDQLKIKEFLWRTTEEITEAFEALRDEDTMKMEDVTVGYTEPKLLPENYPHTLEELADALHFITEIFTMLGMETIPSFPFPSMSTYPVERTWYKRFFDPVYFMGLAANCLKNKPWKSTHIPTDEARFYRCLEDGRNHLLLIFSLFNCTDKDIYNLYMKKNQVNHKRIKSNY